MATDTKIAGTNDPTKVPAGAASSQSRNLADRAGILDGLIRDNISATKNWTPPKPQKVPRSGTFAYLTAPARLKRLFGSPLALEGEYSFGAGDDAVRQVSAGWGATTIVDGVHTGLDFFAKYGEDVFSCGDGRVAFVGYIRAPDNTPVALPGAYQDANGNIHDINTDEVVPRAEVGEGGIVIRIEHNGDFSGYRTEYYNLSNVAVLAGDSIAETNTVIGYVGDSGGVNTPHLHLAVSYSKGGRATIVKPSSLIPNYNPGYEDTTEIQSDILRANFISAGPGVQVIVAGNVAATFGTVDRSTVLQNTTRENVTSAQTAHLEQVSKTVVQTKRQLLEAAALYQQGGLVVINSMTFNFETGLWYIGDLPDAPV